MYFNVKEITRDYVFTFGKHKGDKLEDMLESDPGYLDWCLDNVDWFAEKCVEGLVDEIREAAL